MEPDEIITDFEAGLRLAINNYFPRAVLRGCWYHYCAKIRQRFANLGLSTWLKNNPDARLVKNMLFSLPLLPAEKFNEGYAYIVHKTRQFGLTKRLGRVFEYFEYWIQEVCFFSYQIKSTSNNPST